MSVATEISRITGLRNDLTDILQDKNLISSGSHTLEEDVEAVENFVPSSYQLQTKSITLGQNALSTVYPDSGYVGMSSVSLPVDDTYVKPAYIVSGNRILGVDGTANTIVNIRKIYWDLSSSFLNTKTIVLKSSEAQCYPSGSFTPGDPLPLITYQESEFLLLRTGYYNHSITTNEANILLTPLDSGSNLCYCNSANGSLVFEYFTKTYNSNRTELTITLNGTNNYFRGHYYAQIFY